MDSSEVLMEEVLSDTRVDVCVRCYPMDCSLPSSSVYGILQARILEQVAISFSLPRDRTWISCIAGRFFTILATGKPSNTRV